jgi:Fibronectin type III domain
VARRTGEIGVLRRRLTAVVTAVLLIGGGLVVAAHQAQALSLVTLSGTFEVGGSPVAGAAVTLNGASGGNAVNESTATDAAGHWALHPFAGTSGTLAFIDSLVSANVGVTLAASDTVEDVDVPTSPVTGYVQVVDGSGNPLPGIAVQGSAPGNSYTVSGATSDGAPLTWGTPRIPTLPVCTTDATGTCWFPTFLHLTGTLSATVTDPYGSDQSYPTTFSNQITGTAETDGSTTTIIVDWTHGLVDLSGSVTSAGVPVPGASVAFDGLSTTADADGNYLLHPFLGSSGSLTASSGASSASQFLSVGASATTQDIVLPPAATVVNLSGTVYLGSAPVVGATVALGGISTTTDANGHYTLHPAAGTTGLLGVTFTYGVGFSANAPVTVGSVDQTDDVTVPSGPTTVDVSVVDSTGNPLSGVAVQGQLKSQTSSVLGSTSDGSPVTWGVNFTTQPFTACTTAADGTCTFASLLNLQGSLSASASPFGSDPSYPSQLTDSVTASTDQDPSVVQLQVPTASVVALSGTVTINGRVTAGATVAMGSLHTTTDVDGQYVLHPFAGSSGTVTVSDGAEQHSFPVQIGSIDQSYDLSITDPGVLFLSGTVEFENSTNPDGPGVTVSFAGASTTTDANGAYTLVAPASTTGVVTTNTIGILHTSSPLTTGTMDQTEDLTIPTVSIPVTVDTVDGAGNALPSVNVNFSVPSTPSPVTGTTSSGATLTWWVNQFQGSCLTGADGTCSFQGLTNLPGTFSADHQLVSGNSSYPTLHTSFTGSAPTNGAPVSLAFPNVGYVPSAGSTSGSVLVATSGSSTIVGTSSSSVDSSSLPAGTSAPVGSISYSVHNVPVGGSVDVFVQLPAGTAPTAVFKQKADGSLINVSSLATISGNTIDLRLTDGGLGDADGVANGVISDPLIPVTGSSAPAAPTGVKASASPTVLTTGSLTVTYATPSLNGGSPILSYTATCVSTNGGVSRSASHNGATAASITVPGLTTGKSYQCTVKASNAIGASSASVAAPKVIIGSPAPPTGVTVTRSSAGHLKVAFRSGASNGSPITGYTAVCTSSNGGVAGTKPGTGSPLTVASLTVRDGYRCTVVATNRRGTSLTSSPSAVITA